MLSGKTVLITGGSGAIGSAICRVMAGYGASVAFTYYTNHEQAQQLTAELEAAGGQCVSGPVAATDSAAVQAFVSQVEQRWEKIDILVNNIGATQVMPFALIEEEDWDEMVQVNLKSLFLFSKAVARGMIRRRQGVILNIGSIAGQRLLEVPVHYATAKAGVTGFTLSLAKELCRYQIRVNAIIPGLIEGGIGSNASERQLEAYNEFCSLGRPGKPAEVAELVAFAASDRAAYINGQSLVIDGGL